MMLRLSVVVITMLPAGLLRWLEWLGQQPRESYGTSKAEK